MKKNKANVIWIIADQLRASALGCNGDSNVTTPNINRLAQQGMNYTKAVSGYPLCCPFRGSLLTSKYPHQSVAGHEYSMPNNLKTIASPFSDAGYITGYFGKWHVDGFEESQGRAAFHKVPYERRGGFDMWLGYENNNQPWDSWVHGHDLMKNEINHFRLKEYETQGLTEHTLKFIDSVKRQEKPFFTVLSVQPPHDPYIAPSVNMKNYNGNELKIKKNVPTGTWIEKKARQDLAGYYAQIENLDGSIGRIIDYLIENDLYEQTHIFFFSDHGDMQGSHGEFKKTTFYEEAIRIPMIISGGSVYDGCVNGETEVLINHIDIGPTTLGLCGIEKPEWMDGTDYSSYRRPKTGETRFPESAFIQSIHPTYHKDSCDKAWRGIVTKDHWKYACFEDTDWLMFNLNDDPQEMMNLAHNSRYKQKRTELKNMLKQWIDKTSDRFIVPDDLY